MVSLDLVCYDRIHIHSDEIAAFLRNVGHLIYKPTMWLRWLIQSQWVSRQNAERAYIGAVRDSLANKYNFLSATPSHCDRQAMRTFFALLPIFGVFLSFSKTAAGAFLGDFAGSGSQYAAKCEGSDTDEHWPCFQFKTGSMIGALFNVYQPLPVPSQTLLIKDNHAGTWCIAETMKYMANISSFS